MNRSRAAEVWGAITIALITLAVVLVIVSPFAQDGITRGVYPALGVATFIVLLGVTVVVWAAGPVRLAVAPWTAWVAGGLTLALTLGPIGLWYLGREGLGYQVFQAMGVGTSPYGFGDMDVVLSWLDCSRQGIDPYGLDAVSCAVGPSNYGPAIFVLAPLGVTRSAVPLLGVLGVAISALAIAWILRQSRGWGRVALVLLSASGAWILLQERANLDAAVVWCAVLLVWLTRSRNSLWPWIVAAVPIWILGAWKYYPFALVIALIPAVRLRRGWIVIATFIGLAFIYLIAMRDYVALSLESNSTLSGGEFGGLGRDIAAAFIAGEARATVGWGWGDLLVGAVMMAAAAWGWSVVGGIRPHDGWVGLRRVPLTPEAMLAMSGAVAVLVAVGWSGFGYNYKAALLILGVPLLARLAHRSDRASWRAGVFVLVVIVIACFVTSNLLLASLATLIASAFLAGAAARPLITWIRPSKSVAASLRS